MGTRKKPDVLGTILGMFGRADARHHLTMALFLRAIGVQAGDTTSNEATAHHEAGHVLVGIAIGRKLKRGVRIGNRSDVEFWARKDTDSERRKERVRIAIAGPIAEANYAGSSSGGGADIPLAMRLMRAVGGSWEDQLPELRALAKEVRTTLAQAPVGDLAKAILAKGRLSKKEILRELDRLGWPP